MAIRIDFSNMMDTAAAGGIPPREWTDAAPALRAAWHAVDALRADGTVGLFDLPRNTVLRDQVTRFVTERRDRYADVVVLGIGGSALGPIALRSALRPPDWNGLAAPARNGLPRLTVLENIDPETVNATLSRLDLARTLFVVTSKSGATAETMAQYLVVRERLEGAGLASRDHLAFVTDPAKGALRLLATREGVPALDIPPNVGGRFSVLTPVGTLPAALIGIDIAALLAGADAMVERCATDDVASNPAGALALLAWLADTLHGRHVHVFMPYADALRDLAGWFVQLWAESLGKTRRSGTSAAVEHVGQTPIVAVGATDQHAQLQLYMEGPQDKMVTFVSVTRPAGLAAADVPIPAAYPDIPELAYLGGHSLGELLDVEHRATAGALARRGRPNLTIQLDAVDAWHLGGLMMLLAIATAYAGSLYGIDAFNQPGVELGKQFAYAELGRSDASPDARREWGMLPPPDPRWSV